MAVSSSQLSPARRGEVTKNYQTVRVLAGFMDDAHFKSYAQETLVRLPKGEQDDLLRKVEAARQHVVALPAVDLNGVEVRPLETQYYDKVTSDPLFKDAFGMLNHRFAWIDPRKVVAQQVYVNAQKERVPKAAGRLAKYALPAKWEVPAEISFVPAIGQGNTAGTIYIVTSSPQINGVDVRMEADKGQVIISPPKHINLIQVVHFAGRYYLRNGYHRLFGVIEAGLAEVPAIVIEASDPNQVALFALGAAGFSLPHSAGLMRPPLVADFAGAGCVEISIREKRYGGSVSLQVMPFAIGV